MKTDIPPHHYPITLGMTTGIELYSDWTLALAEFRAWAKESRRRRAEANAPTRPPSIVTEETR